MKLQELLSKHGHDLRWTWRAKLVENYSILLLDIDKSISLSYLLFSTPFLSLLERVKSPNEILVRTEFEWLISPLWCNEEWQQIRCYWNTYQYHKINLVLLNTDAERIEYIEKFTL